MKRHFLVTLTGLLLVAFAVSAAKTTYIYTDRKFNFVKIEPMDKKEKKERKPTHPYNFTDDQLRQALAPMQFSRKLVLEKQVEQNAVFNQASLDMLVPHLLAAFHQAKEHEKVSFSYVTHKPQLLVRDDRLTMVDAWVEDGKLHLYFRKLMAKISNNYDKMSDVTQAMNRAQGLRVALEPRTGQEFGRSTDEVLIHIPPSDIVFVPEAVEEKVVTPKKGKKEAPVATATPAAVDAPANKGVEGRLQQLEELKKKGLVNQKEYDIKKQEILKAL